MAKTIMGEYIFPIKNAVSVLDGDTVKVLVDLGFFVTYTVDVRINGIDTPERSTFAGRYVQLKVEQWLKDLPKGAVLTLISEKLDREKFGRTLGDIRKTFADGSYYELGHFLLEHDYGRRYEGGTRQVFGPGWDHDLAKEATPAELEELVRRFGKKCVPRPLNG